MKKAHATGHVAPLTMSAAPESEPSSSEVIRVELEARETDWEIRQGEPVAGYGYNGQVPGPVIEAKQGVPLEIRFTDRLPEPTTIHWHGLRVPAAMDGTQAVQPVVQPGETFVYRFTPPDAGTFWYHPHTNETEQMEKGLYGALIVRGADEPKVDREQILVFDDLKLDRRGRIAQFGGLKQRHDGREGDVRLVNGRAEPELTIAAGDRAAGRAGRRPLSHGHDERWVQLAARDGFPRQR